MTSEFVDRIANPERVLSPCFEGISSARIYGKIGNLDLYASTCTLTYNNYDLLIDTTLIGPFPYRKGEVYYAYGGFTRRNQKTLVLKAKILKNVAQLDLRLMDAIIGARTAYFNNTNAQMSSINT